MRVSGISVRKPDDSRRIAYIDAALAALRKCIDDGVTCAATSAGRCSTILNGRSEVGLVAAHHPSIDLLVNNAGVALGGTFEEVSDAEFEWMFDINFRGFVRMTRAFLSALHRSPDAGIVNLSSLFGLIAPPGANGLCGEQVRGARLFRCASQGTHGLDGRRDGCPFRRRANRHRQFCASRCEPVGVRGADGKGDFDKFLRLPAEKAGEIIVAAAERRRLRVLVGSDAKLAVLIERIAPVSYWRFIGRAAA